MTAHPNSFGSKATLKVGNKEYTYFSLIALEKAGFPVSKLPFSLKILLENLLRHEDGRVVSKKDVEILANCNLKARPNHEISFMPARVILQDFTGVPAIADLAAMRDAMAELGGNPEKINPLLPSELVIDHSVQVDEFGTTDAMAKNAAKEFERNKERYSFLRWGQKAFSNFKVVPPDTGIVHQVNIEYLARIVFEREQGGQSTLYPDTLVGTDSHTTMANGLGVLGWGVGGIEAEAAMLGQPFSFLIPEVIGVRLTGSLREGTTATDLVLTVTEQLRKKGVVEKFVEFFGPGLDQLGISDRATLANMAPEYGSTCGIFPIDAQTLSYLRFTGRTDEQVELVEAYAKAQGLFRDVTSPDPVFTDILEIDLATIVPSIAGPKRPQDRIPLSNAKQKFAADLPALLSKGQTDLKASAKAHFSDQEACLTHGAVVIAAITSCTNTSNPSVLIAAGLLAKKAVESGLSVKPWVKTSLAPGSLVVTEYLNAAGLTSYLNDLKFHTVGYGCTTCIGNSGPLPQPVSAAIKEGDLTVASVLSGNRNFEGRINPEVRANYLMSPPLVVAYAIAGHMDWDPYNEPIGQGKNGKDVFLKDIWPSQKEISDAIAQFIKPKMFRDKYSKVFEGDPQWQGLKVPEGARYTWDDLSTYVRKPTYFDGITRSLKPLTDIIGARVLASLGDSVTTDHISPAGSIRKDSPAGQYLMEHGVKPEDFNAYGARRGNHEVMVRGTFANIRIKNQLVPSVEGGFTRHLPTNQPMTIYDAAMKYRSENIPSIILAGKEYGSGSSRDWAAKGPSMQGIRAVIAESYERIHRSNLIGMGVLPLQFENGQNRQTLQLTGEEIFEIQGISSGLKPGVKLCVTAQNPQGGQIAFTVLARIDTPLELEYYQNGGILPYVLRQLL